MVQKELFKKIYGRELNGSDTRDFLMEETDNNPYFSLGHYFLLCLTPEEHPEYAKYASRAALYHHDPFLLQASIQRAQDEPLITPMSASIEAAVASFSSPADKQEETLSFEPLHTTDYFASQGIKLSEQVQSGDQLGKQLRSFTEWLKTIKKSTATKTAEVASAPLDETVEQMAAKSNTETEVITEAMAEVFLQQGKKDKAVEVYQKLSLLNPSKSVYFADKIEHLK